MSEILGEPIKLSALQRRIILALAQADGQTWTEDQAASGWDDHMGWVMYGTEARVCEQVRSRAIADTTRRLQASLPEAIRQQREIAWDEGHTAGAPYHRRGNPDDVRNPYRTATKGDR